MNLLLNRNLQVLYLVFLSTTFFCAEVKSQKTELFMGKCINNSNKTPVAFAMISNTSSKENTLSDSLGLFKIYASAGDTLLFSRIGYFTKEILISIAVLNLSKFHIIELNERSYDLNTIKINDLGSYQNFKYNVINSELPKNEYQINPSIKKSLGEKVVVLEPEMRIPLGSPVTALYMLLSKEGKSLRKLAKEEEKDREAASYKDKYSPEIVSKLTGLKELELEKFIKYCNLDANFIKNSLEYEIAQKVLECFKNYKAELSSKEQSTP